MFNANFGDGRLGIADISDGVYLKCNSYARVSNINRNVITITNITRGELNDFTAGENILIHVSATNGTSADSLGLFMTATIQLVNEDRLTLDKNVFDVDLNYYYVQAVTIPQLHSLNLKNATLAPQPFDVFKFTGGILALQVFDELNLIQSYIDLTDAGIPYQKKMTYRPLTAIEMQGETDGSKFARYENFQTAENLLLNSGDGVCFIQAFTLNADKISRIGNPYTHGRANCRGAADSPFKPSNTTNIGGSSILIAAENLDIAPENLAKYRSADSPQGRGLARCHIASNSILPNDQDLYSFDILADNSRLQKLGVHDFGNGSLGNFADPNFTLNNYADVSNVTNAGHKLFYNNKTINGIATFQRGALVVIRSKTSAEFVMARILEYYNEYIIVDNALDAENLQLISVPQFNALDINHSLKISHVGAIAVSAYININANIDVTGGENLNIGNAQSYNKLQSPGLLILAKSISVAENARLNANSMIITENFEGLNPQIFGGQNNFLYL